MIGSKKSAILIIFALVMGLLTITSCNQKSDEEMLQEYLASINATETGTPPGGLPSLQLPTAGAGKITTTYGVPTRGGGFCGDGIVNEGEHCDGLATTHTDCSEIGGTYGSVSCNNQCHMDISDCLTPKVDKLIGGIAETCECSCESDKCSGGCNPTAQIGTSVCRYECDNDCLCNCEGKLEAHLEECEIDCACTLDENNDPECECSLDTCRILSIISPNIGSLIIGDLIR